MVRPRGELPPELTDSLRSFDITQAEINFNATLVLLEVGDTQPLEGDLGALFQTLR